ncbi:MFS general substrate transporter [Trichoderma pleuroticola]
MAALLHGDEKEAPPDESVVATETVDMDALTSTEDTVLDTVNAKYTEDECKRVLKKIDRILLPLMWLCYGTQQADKTAVSTQATFGMIHDIGLVGQQLSWLTTAFYIAYFVGETPGNYLMQRFSVNKILFICMFFWGVVVLCIAFVQDFAQIVALRSLQGLFECTISPAFLLITASFYISQEHTMRSIIWSTANSGFDIIAQLVMYGIGNAAKRHEGAFGSWRWISIFLGSWTILLSFVALFIVGTPNEIGWLSKKEKHIVATRVANNQTGSDGHRSWRWDQVQDTFKDPQTYFFFFTVIAAGIPFGGTTVFGNLVFISFGFTNLETIVKGIIPLDLLAIAWMLLGGVWSLKKPQTRLFLMIGSTIPSFVGMLACGLLPKEGLLWTRWGLYLMMATGRLPAVLIWTLLPSNVAGRTKKSVTSAIMFIAVCIGNAVGSQTFRAEWAPRYVPALVICGIMYAVQCILFVLWRLHYVSQNRRRAKKVAEMGMTPEESIYQGKINGESDMTDWQNIHFRYNL